MAELEASSSTSSVTAALRGASLSTSATAAASGAPTIIKEDLVPQAPATGAAPSPSLEEGSGALAADGETAAPDPDKPNLRYIAGCPGDLEEAKRRWKLTLQWRHDNQIDTILERPHPYFLLIKEAYPHFYCLEGYEGDPVYIERSGQVDQPRLKAAGCGVEELVKHYVYCVSDA